MEQYLPQGLFPVADETASTWGESAIELVQEIGKCILQLPRTQEKQ